MNPDVVIVGAGPVGLFTAIEMKLLNPALKIKILDRNKEYSRHHILRLEEKTLKNSKAYQTFESVKKLNGFVPTSEIESTFLNIAQGLGIDIETGVKVEDSKELLKKYPTAHTVIGADGAHSVIRRQLFDDKKIVDTNLQYIVEIKYKVHGKTRQLPKIIYGTALGQVHHFVSENVGKEKDGSTPVSLFVFVDEDTYKEIREIPNANLADLNPSSQQMEQLLNTIRPWLSLRKVALHEDMVKDSEKINGVALSIYQSACFAKEIDGKRVYVVGDAAAAVPYFRALNAGLIAATLTAQTIANTGVNSPDLELLNQQLAKLAHDEINRAEKTNKKVNLGRGLNFFLANASKITTGALMNPAHEEAMLNARITRPNIFRRNPRTLLTFGFFLVTTAILITLALTVFSLPVLPAILLSIGGATAVVVPLVLIFKLISYIVHRVTEKNNPIQPLPAFPWEEENKEEGSSLLPLKKLSSKLREGIKPFPKEDQNIGNYPDPFDKKTIEAVPYSINSDGPAIAPRHSSQNL